MRARLRRTLFVVLILGAQLTTGFLRSHGLIPLSSGGSGIRPDFFSPLFRVEPEVFTPSASDLPSPITNTSQQALQSFTNKVADGTAGAIRGVYSEEYFALPVVQQPSGRAGFVSTIDGVATQFSMPSGYGVTGILAHNYLSGKYFFDLEVGDELQLVYGNGDVVDYRVADIREYQALQPNSATSQFVDILTGEKISATQLFKRVYMGSHHLTLQTCIEQGSVDSWGRMFVIAYPI